MQEIERRQVLWVFQREPSRDRELAISLTRVFTPTPYQLERQQFTTGYDLLSPFVGIWEGSERNHYLVLHHLLFEEREV